MWHIPNDIEIGIDWRIKIYESGNSSNYAWSENFEILSFITITNPSALTQWDAGKSHEILWISKGGILWVDIEIYNGSNLIYSLVNSTANTGSYFWEIPIDIIPGMNWKVKIIDSNDTSTFAWSDEFEIYTYKSLIITNPTIETRWERGSGQYIHWVTTGNITHVNIEIYKGGGRRYILGNHSENDEAKYWKISPSEEPGMNWRVRIIDSHNSSFEVWSDNFEIYSFPDLFITTPRSESEWEADYSYFITWTKSVRCNTTNVYIELYKEVDLKYSLGQTENDGIFLWSVPEDPEPGTDWYVKITDVDNSSIFAYSDNFEIFTDKSITVVNPFSQSSWGVSVWGSPSSYNIVWSSKGMISHVNIDIYKGPNLEYTINETENDGIFNWTLPGYIHPGSDWRIKITSTYFLNVYDWSAYFEIYAITSILVVFPNERLIARRGEYLDILWNSTGPINRVNIELYENRIFMKTIALNEINDKRHLWRIPESLKLSKDYSIKIINAHDSSLYDFGDEKFEVKEGLGAPFPIVELSLIFGFIGIGTVGAFIIMKKLKKRK